MDEALANALDKVLILSGGDPTRATEALNERYALHAGQSDASASTVSSPTATTSSMGRLSSPARVVSPVQVRSPLIGVLSPTHPGQQTRFGTTPVTPPPSRAPPISPLMTLSRSLPPLMTRNRPLPSAWIEAESDSDDDAVVPTQHPTVGHDSLPPMVPGPAVVPPVVNTLPLVLSQITPEESLLPLNDFQSIRNAILANPFYLGEPSHIRLRNANGDETHRKMKAPSQGTSSPDKWYAIVCGTQVGIFLSWLDAGSFVTGKKGNLYKSFRTEEDAYVWLQVALLKGNIRLLN